MGVDVFSYNPYIGIAFGTLWRRQGKENTLASHYLQWLMTPRRACHCQNDILQIHLFSFQNIGSLRVNRDALASVSVVTCEKIQLCGEIGSGRHEVMLMKQIAKLYK